MLGSPWGCGVPWEVCTLWLLGNGGFSGLGRTGRGAPGRTGPSCGSLAGGPAWVAPPEGLVEEGPARGSHVGGLPGGAVTRQLLLLVVQQGGFESLPSASHWHSHNLPPPFSSGASVLSCAALPLPGEAGVPWSRGAGWGRGEGRSQRGLGAGFSPFHSDPSLPCADGPFLQLPECAWGKRGLCLEIISPPKGPGLSPTRLCS